MSEGLDLNDRTLVEALGPVGQKIVAIPPAKDLDEWAARMKWAASMNDNLNLVVAFLARYVAFPSDHELVAVALWVAHAHLIEQFDTSPILAITSAEMRSGKTRVLDCLEHLAPRPERSITPSEAVVYTVLSERPRCTWLLDEADTIFGLRASDRYEGVRAILNAGNRRGTPVPRVRLEGRHRTVERFDVFGPKAIAGIGNLPTTVADRAIPIRMKRRTLGEPIARFRDRVARAEAARIQFPAILGTLVQDVAVLEELNDRAFDSWEPLLQIAATVGHGWPERARLAAVALSGNEQIDMSAGMRLLGDIQDAFDARGTDHLATRDVLRYLHELDEAPWGDWHGKPLSPRGLARLLQPYRVAPMRQRVGGQNLRGYFRSEFEDTWARYAPAHAAGTSGTSGTRPGDVPPVPPVPQVPGHSRPRPNEPTLWEDLESEDELLAQLRLEDPNDRTTGRSVAMPGRLGRSEPYWR